MTLAEEEEELNWSPIKIIQAPDLTKEDPSKRSEGKSDDAENEENEIKMINALDGENLIKYIDLKLKEKYPHIYNNVGINSKPPIAIAPFDNKPKEVVEETEGLLLCFGKIVL